jgi:zinc D-Ala-D-Ala carboxypeptidase
VAIVRQLLITRLEALRSVIRRAVPIVSGYRCPVHNPVAGGAANSQHMYGAAADLPSGLVPVELAERMFVGVGHKGGWAIHVDVRDGARTTWAY